MITPPTQSTYQSDRKTTILRFENDDSHPMTGEYYCRGGICWPVVPRTGAGGIAIGHAVMVGFNLQTKCYTVFEDVEFRCIDPILENGRMTFEGIANWLNNCWARYFCHYFYYNAPELVHRTYLMQVLRSEMVSPKPAFIEIPWQSDDQVLPVFWSLINTKRLKQSSAAIKDQARQCQGALGSVELALYPAVYALTCALVAMERWPWRERI